MIRAPAFWQRDGWAARLLSPLAQVTRHMTARRVARSGWRAPIPVICCGNVTVGGAGKTTVALDLARRLAVRGIAVHVLLRGYGARARGPRRVRPDDSPELVGDEALLLAGVAPTWIGADRAASARAAVASGAQVLVMDDGLQNPTLEKDLALLVIDGATGFGNGRCLPAGPLREPVVAAAARCQAAVLIGSNDGPSGLSGFGVTGSGSPGADATGANATGADATLADATLADATLADATGATASRPAGARTDAPAAVAWLASVLPVLRARLVQGPEIEALRGRRVLAFAGIARPEKFFAPLAAAGAVLVAQRGFPDHHAFRPRELAALLRDAARLDAVLVTTPKDAVRLPAPVRERVTVITVHLEWQDDIDAWLNRALAPRLPEHVALRAKSHHGGAPRIAAPHD